MDEREGYADAAHGPGIAVVVDRRVRPWAGRRRERRRTDRPVIEDRRIAERNRLEGDADFPSLRDLHG